MQGGLLGDTSVAMVTTRVIQGGLLGDTSVAMVTTRVIQGGSVLHAFWFKMGPRPPIGFAKGGPKFFKEGPFFVVEILTSFEEFGGQFCVYC
jgi:hypothetical protein